MHALAWLTANPEHGGWGYVFDLLWAVGPEQRRGVAYARARLADRKSRT